MPIRRDPESTSSGYNRRTGEIQFRQFTLCTVAISVHSRHLREQTEVRTVKLSSNRQRGNAITGWIHCHLITIIRICVRFLKHVRQPLPFFERDVQICRSRRGIEHCQLAKVFPNICCLVSVLCIGCNEKRTQTEILWECAVNTLRSI